MMAEFIKVDGTHVGDIKLYALSTCGWCKRTKKYFDDRDIEYFFIDVDMLPDNELDRVLEEQLSYNPQGSFPTIVVNGDEVIVGYDERKLKALVED